MPFASSSLAELSYIEEATWGDIPAATFKELRWTGESLAQSTTTEVSNEIRPDRQVPDVIRTDVEAAGDINVEMSYGAFDDLLEGAFMGVWSADLGISATDLSAEAGDNSFNSSGTSLAGIQEGQWFRVSGFASAQNNGYFQASSVAANKVVVTGGTLSTEAAGPTVVMSGSNLRNGTAAKSFTIQKHFSDVGEYVAFTGMRVASLNLTVDTGSLITGAFSFQGKVASASGSSAGSGSPSAAPTNPVLNAIDNIEGLVVGDGSQAFSISSHNFTLDNTLRAQKAQGTLGSVGIGLGTLNVTGALTAYFENRSLYEQYLGFSTSSFAYRVIDAAGNAYIVTFPALKFTDGNPVAGGRDQDILAEMSWTAFRHPTLGFTAQIDRFPA
jgi:hypothetical protein